MSSTVVYTSTTGTRSPIATAWELADPELRPVRNIRRPIVAKRQPRLTAPVVEALSDAERARRLRENGLPVR